MKKRFFAGMLAAVMLTASAGLANVLAEEAVYSYMDEDGNNITITQSQLDEGHWNTDALGDGVPFLYEDFPMSINGYVSDFGEIALDCIYMKNIRDMESVCMKITNLFDGEVVYDSQIEKNSFYSPVLEAGTDYEVVLTEVTREETKRYSRVAHISRTEAQMPEYVLKPAVKNDAVILVGDVEDLKAGQTKNDAGQMVIDTSVAKYDKITAANFSDYCNTLPSDKLYRIYTRENNRQYAGFLSTEGGKADLYDLTVDMYTWDSYNNPLPMTLNQDIPFATVKDNAQILNLTDACFKLTDNTNNSRWRAFRVDIPQVTVDDYAEGKLSSAVFDVAIKGTVKISAKRWLYRNKKESLMGAMTSNNLDNSTTTRIDLSNFKPIQKGEQISFFFLVYFPSATSGYGMISFNPVSGYEDDVTGSVYQAYNGESAYSELPNTEFTMTDSWDVDAFFIDYMGTADKVYKIEFRNRSLAEQAKLESGIYANGSPAKYLTFVTVGRQGNELDWDEIAVYNISKNTDMVIYDNVADTGTDVIVVNNQSETLKSSNQYQLSFLKMPQSN